MWFEDLPEGCPSKKSSEPDNQDYFRLINKRTPKCKDFWSYKKLIPDKPYENACPCEIRAVSIFNSIDGAIRLKKVAAHKKKHIGKIQLTYNDGKILKTGKDETHYAWWRPTGFDPASCSVVEI